MRYPSLVLAVLGLGVAGEAAAVPAQCFWQGGQAVGPVYLTEGPTFYAWVQWAQRRGAHCRPISEFERQSLEKRPQVYPPEFTSDRGPGYRPPGYDQPPPGGPDGGWVGDPNRAAYLVTQWLAQQGRPYGQVRDTGRIQNLYDRNWRIYFVRWADGNRVRVAVRFSRREGGTYAAMQSHDGVTWSQPQPIGQ